MSSRRLARSGKVTHSGNGVTNLKDRSSRSNRLSNLRLIFDGIEANRRFLPEEQIAEEVAATPATLGRTLMRRSRPRQLHLG